MTIPTMWASKSFHHFLGMLVRVPVVSEIHVINNFVSKTPDLEVLKNPKIKLYNQEKNIGCHPAWNLGVENSTSENVCIFSDDIIFDLKLLYEVDDFLNAKDDKVGLLAMDIPFTLMLMQMNQITPVDMMLGGRSEITITKKPNVDKSIAFTSEPSCLPEESRYLIPDGIIEFHESSIQEFGPGGGAIFFCKRKNWIPIPNELVKDFGDRWCWHVQRDIGRQNFKIKNCFFHHVASATCNSKDGFNGLEVDYKNESGEGFRKVINRWRNENGLPILDYP